MAEFGNVEGSASATEASKQRKRGLYLSYLSQPTVKIPKTTLYRNAQQVTPGLRVEPAVAEADGEGMMDDEDADYFDPDHNAS